MLACKDFPESGNIDQYFWSFCGENQFKENLPTSTKMLFLVFTLIYHTCKLQMHRKAVLFWQWFFQASRDPPLEDYVKSLCCFGKNGGTTSGTHPMNFKKIKQGDIFVAPRVCFRLCVNKRKIYRRHQRVAVFGNMPRQNFVWINDE